MQPIGPNNPGITARSRASATRRRPGPTSERALTKLNLAIGSAGHEQAAATTIQSDRNKRQEPQEKADANLRTKVTSNVSQGPPKRGASKRQYKQVPERPKREINHHTTSQKASTRKMSWKKHRRRDRRLRSTHRIWQGSETNGKPYRNGRQKRQMPNGRPTTRTRQCLRAVRASRTASSCRRCHPRPVRGAPCRSWSSGPEQFPSAAGRG